MSPVPNECIPLYEPGDRITGHADVALTGRRCVTIVGSLKGGGPELVTSTLGSVPLVGLPAAGAQIFGVTSHDVADEGKVTIIRGPGFVVPISAAGTINAGELVKTDANGEVVTHGGTGTAIGMAIDGATAADDCLVALF